MVSPMGVRLSLSAPTSPLGTRFRLWFNALSAGAFLHMKRFTISAIFLALLATAWFSGGDAKSHAATGVSGQGKMKFRLLYTSDILPAEAKAVLTNAHGGFAVDTRPGKGETYFSLKGAGIIQISSDLKTTRLLDTAADMKNTNLHNASIW